MNTSREDLIGVATLNSDNSTTLPYLVDQIGPVYATILLLSLLLAIFFLLAKVCDEAVAPCLSFASEYFNIPTDVSCATFLALGSSAPEIVISCVSIASEDQDVSLGTLFGSGIIAFTLIPALCVFVSEGSHLHLQVIPLLRDSGFFCLGIVVFTVSAVVSGGLVYWYECLVMVLLFVVYLISMRMLAKLYASDTREKALSMDDEENAQVEAIVEEQSSATCWAYCLPPFFYTSQLAMEAHWGKILFVAIVYVSIFAQSCVLVTNALAQCWHISANVLAVLLVALGAQIPDTVASMAVARTGEGPGAIANCIGSQVLSVLLGLGLPFFVSCLIQGKGIRVDFSQTFKLGLCLLVAISSLLGLALRRPMMKIGDCGLSKHDAMFLCAEYFVFILSEVI